MPDHVIIATTPRLVVRRLTTDDAPFMLAMLNDPDFIRHVADRGVRTVDEAVAYLERGALASYATHGHGLYAVVERGATEPIGMCGLLRRDSLDGADLGYAFLAPARGRGYAREAAAAVMAHARDDLGLDRVLAIVDPANGRSIRVLEDLGFSLERLVRLPDFDADVALYAATVPSSVAPSPPTA